MINEIKFQNIDDIGNIFRFIEKESPDCDRELFLSAIPLLRFYNKPKFEFVIYGEDSFLQFQNPGKYILTDSPVISLCTLDGKDNL